MLWQLPQTTQSPGRRAGVSPGVSPRPLQRGWVLRWVIHLFQGRREVGDISWGGKGRFPTSDQLHRYFHPPSNTLWDTNPSAEDAPRAQDPTAHTCIERCLSSAPAEPPRCRPFAAQTLCGELVYKKKSAGFPNKAPSPHHISSHT